MYYVATRQRPAAAPHPAPRARRQPVRRGAVRGRGVHRPQLAALPPDAADPDPPDRAGPAGSQLEAADDGLHRHRLTKTGGRASRTGDVDHRAGSRSTSTTTSSSGSSARPEPMPDGHVLPQRRRRRDALRPRGQRRLRHDLRAARATARATTSSCRSARPGAWTRTPARRSGCSTWRRRRRSSRRSATATTTASCSSTRRTRSATSTRPTTFRSRATRPATSSSTSARRTGSPPTTTGTTRSTSSAGTATSGRSASTSRDFQPITGRVHQPPPVHQTFQARNFVVCSFVPRKFDYHPLAIPAPYNHSNINSDEVIYYVAGNFMSRRGVEIASFTAPPGRASRTARIRARSRRRSARRRPRSWRSWSTRSTRSSITRQAARARRRRPTRISWLPPEDAARRGPRARRARTRRRSRTDRGVAFGNRTTDAAQPGRPRHSRAGVAGLRMPAWMIVPYSGGP